METTWKVAIGTALAFGAYLWVSSRKPSKPLKVLAVGDSLTASAAYCAALKEQLPVGSTLSCRGLKGQGTAPILRDLQQNIKPGYDYVVVLAGVNDLASGRSLDSIQRNLEQMYLEIRANGAQVIAVTLTPWSGHRIGKTLVAKTDELNTWIKRHKLPDKVVNTSSLGDFSGRLLSHYGAADGLHLNPEGSAQLAELVWKQGF
jgi:lysophospholipase L1-like esterase